MSAKAHHLAGDDILIGGRETEPDAHFTLGDLLAIQAEARPAAIFLESSFAPAPSITYAQAHDLVSRLSAFLRSLKLPQGAVIGLLMPNQPHAVIALMSCLEAGYCPLMLAAHERYADLSALIQHTQCAALITDDCADRALPDLSVRLAAACEDVRFVMSFGDSPPNGVLSIAQAMRMGNARAQNHEGSDSILVAGANHRPERLSIDALIATATEHAAESSLGAEERIICPLRLHSMQALCCGLISALMAGAQLQLIDAPDSAALTTALMSTKPVHLLWPGALEDMLDDIPAHALNSVTVFHKIPWERHAHRGMTRMATELCIDAWIFPNRLIALARRNGSAVPVLPNIGEFSQSAPPTNPLTLCINANGQILAAGTTVQGFSDTGWIDLSCKAFRDQDGTIVAIEMPAARPKTS